MARDNTPQTPLRRSKRGQPLLSEATNDLNQLDAPAGSCIHSRRARMEDLWEEEREILDLELDAVETRFYIQYSRREVFAVKREPRVYGRSRRTKQDEDKENSKRNEYAVKDTFSVGDTVLVETTSREPSVAVIVAIWEILRNGEPQEKGLRVMVHWFNKPNELPPIRARRGHAENEIYYSLASLATIPPSNIVSTCIVSSTQSGSPVPKRRGHQNAQRTYYCAHAVDPRRGFFYQFHWEEFRQQALSAATTSTSVADSTQREYHHAWNVMVDEAGPSWSRSPRKRARTQSIPIEGQDEEEEQVDTLLEGDGASEAGESSLEVIETLAVESESEDGSSVADEYHPREEDDHSEEEGGEGIDEEEDEPADLPQTPSRKRKRTAPAPRTPRKPRTPRTPKTPRRTTGTPRRSRTQQFTSSLAQPTPHSKAALRKRKRAALAVRPPPLTEPGFNLELDAHLGPVASQDPWLRAMHVLHVAARPEALPCRDEEYNRILRAVEQLLEEGSGGCIYISGVPGTGKTATVHAIVRQLKWLAEQSEANPFTYVEINGLRIPEPAAAYGLLWEAVSGHDTAREGHMKISSNQALKALSRHFSAGERAGPGSHACVVLMDELDQLMTTKQDVVYNFFNWPTLVSSKLIVLAVANTMDLPERVMSGRVRSRLGMVRINFQPYTTPQLEKIVHARLQSARDGLPADARNVDVIAPDGIKFAAMKVSSISGDARRVLDICRRTVELVQSRKRPARAEDVQAVIKELQNSPTAAYVRELSLHERLMLAALLRCVKREGVDEIRWGDIQRQHLIYTNLLSDPAALRSTRRPTLGELRLVLDNLLAAHALLAEDVGRRAEDERRVVLNLEHGEVERVLGEVGGPMWRDALSA
ncbi:P-loop containing nucleoside triphosphate hydrolase protein [Laetiporus sulphureus 93-53]|uniref:Origin recognition complex subunit 1 n=1 Tax=Laetiporus sulphureus 93-53 TaxID=1314785 RepID=A0A165EN62_9APHY|nr:P-loop containing nucleoside triphosphate hydrolase protein [Laetiporus sulphureus 93-53]KZT07411.1 P-loop containing nucleoside triphosphate hydrolase protein [Laetiporus sulphureus 93-53]